MSESSSPQQQQQEVPATFQVFVKATFAPQRIEASTSEGATVAELKQVLSSKVDVPAAQQRLIFKGQILQDDKTCGSYGIKADSVLHLVKSKPPAASGGENRVVAGANPSNQAGSSPGGVSPFPGMPGFGQGAPGGAAGGDPMAQMMSNPMLQSMMSNPDFMRTIVQTNPMIQQMIRQSPELGQVFNNPDLMREYMQIASNPALAREHNRTTDRALNNIESHPEGYNALRNLYSSMQAAEQSTAGMDPPSAPAPNPNPFSDLWSGMAAAMPGNPGNANPSATSAAATTTPNAEPLPNPWAAPVGGAPPGRATPGGWSPGGAGGMFGGMSPGMGPGMVGGGLPGMMMDPSQISPEAQLQMMQQLSQNPQALEPILQMMTQPEMLAQMERADPQLGNLLRTQPALRQVFQNPDVMRQVLNPTNMQNMMQMQRQMGPGGMQAMMNALGQPGADTNGLAGIGAFPSGLPGGGGGLPSLLGGLNLGGGPVATVANPQEAYATQISQLQAMGFADQAAVIRALQATGGNVEAAVERLLQPGL